MYFEGEPRRVGSRYIWAAIGIGFVLSLSFIWRINELPLYEPDEARYAEVSREMIETGHYLIPQLNYEPRIKKPALFQWIIAGSMHVFDDITTAARAPSVVAAVLLLVTMGWFASRVFRAGIAVPLTVGIFGVSAMFWMMARMAMVDVWLAWCITMAIMFLYLWEREEKKYWFWLAGLAAVLGANFKGPVALAVPVVVFFTYAFLQKRGRELWRAAPWGWWLAGVVLLSIPWYVAAIIKLGGGTAQFFVLNELVGRFFGGGENRAHGLFFYFGIGPMAVLPWTILLFVGLVAQIREIHKIGWAAWKTMHPLQLFFLSWMGAVMVFFSISSAKLMHYIFPLVPVVALFIVDFILKHSSSREERSGVIWIIGLFALSAIIYLMTTWGVLHGAVAFIAAVLVVIYMTVMIGLVKAVRKPLLIIAIAVVAILPHHLVQLSMTGMPLLWRSQRNYGKFIHSYQRDGVEILSHGVTPSSVLSEIRCSVKTVDPWYSMAYFASHKPVLLLGRKKELAHFKAIIDTRPVADLKIEVNIDPTGVRKSTVAYNRAYREKYMKDSTPQPRMGPIPDDNEEKSPDSAD